MNNSRYPALLSRRARIFASLNRSDLLIMGVNYIVLSKLGLNGIEILVVCLILLVVLKFFTSRVERGFLSMMNTKRIIKWSYKIGAINE